MRLETSRLVLRDWDFKDINDLTEGLNNIEVSKWLAFVPHPYTVTDAENWIHFCAKNISSETEKPFYHFAIELKAEQKVIGGLSLDSINKSQKTAGGGIWLNAKYHGQGYGTEAFNRRIAFAFEELQLRRIENGYFRENTASLKMQEKLGYQIEGLRRQAFICMANGEIMDEYITGLLKDEWIKA